MLPAESLVGALFLCVESRGKHLLKRLDDERTLHSHLGMHGSWHVYRPGQPWQKPARWAALVVEVPEIVCGIGNVYKSEVLFLCRTNPFVQVGQLADDAVLRIIELARELMLENLDGYPRRTRFGLDRQNHWVYGRRGRPCFVCGCRMQLRRQGDLGRTTFWCPKCQEA